MRISVPLRRIFLAWAAAGAAAVGAAQEHPDYGRILARTEAMIPMRDGARLHTMIYTPIAAAEPLPILITRTPYGVGEDANGYAGILRAYGELIHDGYIFVVQDIRGRYGSEGQFVMLRPPRPKSDPKAIDESTDTYDTIEWLVKNLPGNNGRVGVLGISYGGWLTVMAMLDPHPALKAVSEQASPADMFLGDDFHHNGAFRLSYGFEYAAMMETGKESFRFHFDLFDTFEWYLGLGPLSNANADYLHGQIPSWNDFVNHPNYDEFWKKQSVITYLERLAKPTVPNLNVAGWWDQEDFYGPVEIYELVEKHDTGHENFLVVGPWNHGGWARADGDSLGNIKFKSPTSKFFREKIQAAWFAHWLKGKGSLPFSEAEVFETGTNRWRRYDTWPPAGAENQKLYMRASGQLSFEPPSDAAAFDSYISDPRNPVPYRHRPVEPTYPGGGWPTWLTEDQRFVDSRPDTLTWKTPPLVRDLTVAGDIVAHLFASTTGSDSDWIVKLIDVYPEDFPEEPRMGGYELMIADEVFRGRFRRSFEAPQPIPAGRVEPYTIDLHTNDHCFLKGHRIMVQVESTWFPLIDRNPQKFVPNIFKALDSDYQVATQRIYRSKPFPSNVELPVMGP